MTATAVPRTAPHAIGHYERTPTHVIDLRDAQPDQFDDVSATEKAVIAAGGRIELPRVTIPTVGRLIKFRDTEGNLVGAMQYEAHLLG